MKGKNFYLSTFLLLKEGKRPSEIKDILGFSKQRLNYYLSSLKDKGYIKKIGYGTWEIIKEFAEKDLKEVKKSTRVASNQLKQDDVRGHAFQFVLILPEDLKNWNNREEILKKLNVAYEKLNFGGIYRGQKIIFEERKVWLLNKSIIIYEKESFIKETAKEAKNTAISHFLAMIKRLERLLRANFSHFGKYKFKVTRQHYALIKNALASQYNKEGKKLEVYNEKGLIFLIDDSFKLEEFEAVHPKTAVSNNEAAQNFFRSLAKNPITTEDIYKIAERQDALTEVIKKMDRNVIYLTKIIHDDKRDQ